MRRTRSAAKTSPLAQLLQTAKGVPADDHGQLARLAGELAGGLWARAQQLETRAERQQRERLARLMADAQGVAFSTLLTDRAFRSTSSVRLAGALSHLAANLGTPSSLGAVSGLQLRAAQMLSRLPMAHDLIAEGARRRMRHETRSVLVSASEPALSDYLAQRETPGVRVNVNLLGEAVLSEAEVARRMTRYLALLARPDVSTISVKVSSIDCRVDPLAFEATLERLAHRLGSLYEAALAYRTADGAAKLVNLDMESYAELPLTLALFQRVLGERRFQGLYAGVVLQSYLPDAFFAQVALTRFAQQRVAAGGSPIRLRIVKGANMAMEEVHSELHGLVTPTYGSKAETDQNYKRMLCFAARSDNAAALHVGAASHNVFDLALALCLRAQHGSEAYVGIELLEGMANPLQRSISEICPAVLVYCPIVAPEEMQSAIAYLLRRLDENSSKDNFLRKSFAMAPGSPVFTEQLQTFLTAYARRDDASTVTRRVARDLTAEPSLPSLANYRAEPDTDFALEAERIRVRDALFSLSLECPQIASVLADRGSEGATEARGFDPSRPGHVPYVAALANADDLEHCLDRAQEASEAMALMPVRERGQLLAAVAKALRADRPALIAHMVIDAGKRIDQADVEISEAIDFAEYYRLSFDHLASDAEVICRGRGVTLVTPPWNFPLAIPAGGAFAALMAGNAVILKPALETAWVAHRLVSLCHAAGIPKDALQLCLCTDELGGTLVQDPRVRQVVLTGGTSTARLFGNLRPELRLIAETGGKNAIIVSAMADRDQAISDVLASAFGHAGQKCSAAGLLICEAEVYDDPHFLSQLKEAAESLPVGSAHDPRNVVTPLIRPPEGALQRALSAAHEGSKWLLRPQVAAENPRLVSPGILLSPPRRGFMHRTELFGPVLSVMRARDLYDAIDIANETPYGLTAGLHSLDERDQQRFIRRMGAGNLYINRTITGAVVGRQAFGGWKASSYGSGAKAGGPNYVLQLCDVTQAATPQVRTPPHPRAADFLARLKAALPPPEQAVLSAAACSYGEARVQTFAQAEDHCQIRGEDNWHRYLPLTRLLIRLADPTRVRDALLACMAALTVGTDFVLSVPPGLAATLPMLIDVPGLSVREESESALRMRLSDAERLRYVGEPGRDLSHEAIGLGLVIDAGPALLSGRFELVRYLKEQSVTVAHHRHGNLSAHALQRSPDGLP